MEFSSEARTCPSCGIKRPVKKKASILAIVGVLCILPLAFFIASSALDFDWGRGALPLCDSAEGRSQVDAAIANAPLGRVRGISVIEYKNIETVSTTPTEVHCKAGALLNNSFTKPISYSFTNEDNRLMVRFQLMSIDLFPGLP